MSAEPLAGWREAPANPFPGLRPFETGESDLFFGRRDDVRELLGRLRRVRFLAVVGASGCGKSSLIKAGLLAALRDGFMLEAGAAWRLACLRPGDNPIGRLAEALHAPGALGDPCAAPEERAALEATLRRGSLGLLEAVAEAPLPPNARLFILVDQFEELFRFAPGDERAQGEARAFVKLLIEAVVQRQWPIYVALTMRSDFLGQCAALPALPEAINQGLYLVPQMGRSQLREAIKGPVELCGAAITERLVNRLLNDLGDDPDQLPILQHALMRMWELRREGPPQAPLDLDHYQHPRIGGLGEALSRHLEEVYEELDARGSQIAEWLFRNLTETTEARQVVRRPIRLGRIARSANASLEEVAGVIDRFRAPGRSFLMPPCEVLLAADTMIDISHESLIRQWKRLSGWAVAQDKDSRLAREIAKSAALWNEKGREASYLFHGARLAEAGEWRKAHPDEAGDLEREFIEEGTKLREQQILARHESELPQKVADEAVVRERAIARKTAYVYISSCPKDRQFVHRLREALTGAGLESWTEPEAVVSGPALNQSLAAIDAADVVLCVLSPDYALSGIGRMEVDHALKGNKRLIPVLYREVDSRLIHPALAELSWLDLRGGSLDEELHNLLGAIDTDLGWVQMHTRILLRSTEWKGRGRDRSLLLHGKDLEEAEAWLATNAPHRQPKVTEDQIAYLLASRQAKTRLQTLVLGLMTLAFLGMVFLAGLAYFQRQTAEEQRRLVLEQWGRLSVAALDNPVEVQVAQESYAANEEIQKSVQESLGDPAILQRRRQVRVEYYTDLGDQVKASKLEFDLRGLGFSVESLPRRNRGETNAVWFGSGVDPDDVDEIAYLLIRAGVPVKYLGCFKDSAGRERVVQIGGKPNVSDDKPLTVEQIDRGEVIRPCLAPSISGKIPL